MPTSPKQLFAKVGYTITGSRPWGTRPDSRAQGVYVVSLHANPSDRSGLPRAPISEASVAEWIARVPTLTLDDKRPSPSALKRRLARYWLPDEAIVYIGKATSLSNRVAAFYSTPLGNAGPHAGGCWLKTLKSLKSLTVHYAELAAGTDARTVEGLMLRVFSEGVSRSTKAAHPQPDLTIPFGNLEVKPPRRNHGIRHATL